MKVGYVLKRYPRLSETFIEDEMRALEELGVDVTVFSLHEPDASSRGAVVGAARRVVYPTSRDNGRGGSAADGQLHAKILDRIPAEKRKRVLERGRELAVLVEDEKIEHLHAHFMTVAAWVAYIAHALTGVSFSVTAHAKDIYRNGVDEELFRAVAAEATMLVTVCDFNKRYIENRFAPSNEIRVIYNGVFRDRFVADATPRDPRLILGVGRLVEKKGWDVLIRACAALRDQGVDLRCEIVGDGDRRDDLLGLVRQLGLEDRLDLVGPASRMHVLERMRTASVLAAPCVRADDGNQDALPTVLLEALSTGTPQTVR